MTDLQRETLKALGDVLNLAPDIRVGQLFAHLGFLGEAHLGRGLGYVDDDELLAIVYRHKAELEARAPASDLPGSATSVSGSPTIPTTAPAA